MQVDLIKIRAIAFLQDLKALFLAAGLTFVIEFLSSPELVALIDKYFGAALAGMVAKMVLGAILNHLRNVKIVNNPPVGGWGAKGEYPTLL